MPPRTHGLRGRVVGRGVGTAFGGKRFNLGSLRMKFPLQWLTALGLCAVLLPGAQAQTVDAARGEALFKSRCGGCHSLERNRAGPALGNVFGRVAGKVPHFRYSKALGAASHVWTREALLAWLSGPEALVPGQAMGYHLALASDRQDVVQFLAQVKQNTAAR